MARITVEDCQERVDNRFLLVQMTIKRVYQYREGYESLVDTRNKEVVTALREIAAGKILPEDRSYFTPSDGTKRHIAGYDSDIYETDDYIVEVPDISAANARLAQVQAMDLAAYDKATDDDDDVDDGVEVFAETLVGDDDDDAANVVYREESERTDTADTFVQSFAEDEDFSSMRSHTRGDDMFVDSGDAGNDFYRDADVGAIGTAEGDDDDDDDDGDDF